MKFIKYAVGLVIALSVIPLVVVTVNNLETSKRLQTIEFEVIDYNEPDGEIIFNESTYNDILAYVILDNVGVVSNLVSGTYNNNTVNLELSKSLDNEFTLEDLDGGAYYFVDLTNYDTADVSDFPVTIGDKWSMTFEVPTVIPPLVKLLVGFAPLLFVGGILLFMLNKRKLD